MLVKLLHNLMEIFLELVTFAKIPCSVANTVGICGLYRTAHSEGRKQLSQQKAPNLYFKNNMKMKPRFYVIFCLK